MEAPTDSSFYAAMGYTLAAAAASNEDVERSVWVHEINQDRATDGDHARSFETLKAHPEKFKQTYRVYPSEFNDLLGKVKVNIESKVEAGVPGRVDFISAEMKLALTLRFLAQGTVNRELSRFYHCGESTVRKSIKETLSALWDCLHQEYIVTPSTSNEWLAVAQEFKGKWQFPNCLGAIDGKHIRIKKPAGSGTMYYCYKGFPSIILLAVVDAKYCFRYIDVGEYGKAGDAGTFSTSDLAKAMSNDSLNIPTARPLMDGTDAPMPFVFVGDEAFPLQEHMMRPYPLEQCHHNWDKTIYNYRLSRARRIVENAFGMLVNRWRLLLNAIECNVENADLIVKCCCVLHNYCQLSRQESMDEESDKPGPDGQIVPGIWRQFVQFPVRNAQATDQGTLLPLDGRYGGNKPSRMAENIRTKFSEFFNGDGAVSWQNSMAMKH